MGRAIYYFMLGEDETRFMQYILENGDSVVDRKGKTLDISFLADFQISQAYIKPARSELKVYLSGMDEDESNVLEWSRSTYYINRNEVHDGRLFLQTYILNSEKQFIRKEKWLEDKFDLYKKYIVKSCRINKNKRYYFGETALKLAREKNYKLMYTPNLQVDIAKEF